MSDYSQAVPSEVGQVHYVQTVLFPDGTEIDSPHQDAYGSVYPSSGDWISGSNPHELVDDI
jgi:hypothetical protein